MRWFFRWSSYYSDDGTSIRQTGNMNLTLVLLALITAGAHGLDEMTKCDAITICDGASGGGTTMWCAGKGEGMTGCGNSDVSTCETDCADGTENGVSSVVVGKSSS